MPAPNIQIIFKQKAITAIKRGERGIVALILRDSTHNGFLNMVTINDIPQDLSPYNKSQLQLAFMGGINPPVRVISYIMPTTTTDYTDALAHLETSKWNYLVVPGIVQSDAMIVATWIKSLRDTKDIKVKAVLPHLQGDHEGIINFDTDNIVVGQTTYAAKDYCSRIAGILAGTPLQISATYSVLREVDDVPRLSKAEIDAAVDAGKLILMNDGEKVKIVRAVNSFQTTNSEKGTDFKKIKLIDIMDQIHDDVKGTIADSYVGKYPNDYDHKCLLIVALRGYCEGLESISLLQHGMSTIDIDIPAQTQFLHSVGIDTSTFTGQQLKEANTSDKVFIGGNVKILDAMEDFILNIGL